jgi:hypothetical protein
MDRKQQNFEMSNNTKTLYKDVLKANSQYSTGSRRRHTSARKKDELYKIAINNAACAANAVVAANAAVNDSQQQYQQDHQPVNYHSAVSINQYEVVVQQHHDANKHHANNQILGVQSPIITEAIIRNSALKIISTDDISKHIMLGNYRAAAQESREARAAADTADKMYVDSIKNSPQYAINSARDYARAANKYAQIADMKVLNLYRLYTKLCGLSITVQKPICV